MTRGMTSILWVMTHHFSRVRRRLQVERFSTKPRTTQAIFLARGAKNPTENQWLIGNDRKSFRWWHIRKSSEPGFFFADPLRSGRDVVNFSRRGEPRRDRRDLRGLPLPGGGRRGASAWRVGVGCVGESWRWRILRGGGNPLTAPKRYLPCGF